MIGVSRENIFGQSRNKNAKFDILGVASKEVSWCTKSFAIVNSERLHCVRGGFVSLEKASRQSF